MLNGTGLDQAFKMSLPRRARIGASVGEPGGWATGAGAAPGAGRHCSALRPVPSPGSLGLRDSGRHALLTPGQTTFYPRGPKSSHGAGAEGARGGERERSLTPLAPLCMRVCVCMRRCVCMYPCVFVCVCVPACAFACACTRARARLSVRPYAVMLMLERTGGSCSFLPCSHLLWAQFGQCRELLASQVGYLHH